MVKWFQGLMTPYDLRLWHLLIFCFSPFWSCYFKEGGAWPNLVVCLLHLSPPFKHPTWKERSQSRKQREYIKQRHGLKFRWIQIHFHKRGWGFLEGDCMDMFLEFQKRGMLNRELSATFILVFKMHEPIM